MKNLLTIAGFDPSSGAGITKDLDVFFSLGMHGISVPTCIVNQGPRGVTDVYPTPPDQFSQMLATATEGVRIDGVKIGAMCDEPHVEILSEFISSIRVAAGVPRQTAGLGQGFNLRDDEIPVVLDPVISAKNNTRLLTDRGLKKLVDSILPLTTVITPNIDEACIITGKMIVDLDDMKSSAQKIMTMKPRAVIIKGGHLAGEPLDLLYDGRDFSQWQKRRIDREVHGTGCTFSAALLIFLVQNYSLKEAFIASEEFMLDSLKDSYRIDEGGYFYMSSALMNSRKADQWNILSMMKETQQRLLELNMVELIPAVQMNVGYALTDARGIEDVAAFPGRIGHHQEKVWIKGAPVFGASSHVARLIITYMRHFPHIRSCVNIKYNESIIEKARKKGMYVVYFDRKQEPENIKEAEGRSLDFLVEEVLKVVDTPPDIIYDTGDTGKEPIIRLFAEDPIKLIKKMEMIRS
jgi:hydroxymethylpyrimidine/phosphomethylpyrimidine kinase